MKVLLGPCVKGLLLSYALSGEIVMEVEAITVRKNKTTKKNKLHMMMTSTKKHKQAPVDLAAVAQQLQAASAAEQTAATAVLGAIEAETKKYIVYSKQPSAGNKKMFCLAQDTVHFNKADGLDAGLGRTCGSSANEIAAGVADNQCHRTAVRCCNGSGTPPPMSDYMPACQGTGVAATANLDDFDFLEISFQDASEFCTSKGLTLCAHPNQNVGCWFSREYVWTSTECSTVGPCDGGNPANAQCSR